MFANPNIEAISVIENQIQTLEYALAQTTIGDYHLARQLTIELGHLYNAKMQIIKYTQNESSINKTFNIKTYQSKINEPQQQEPNNKAN